MVAGTEKYIYKVNPNKFMCLKDKLNNTVFSKALATALSHKKRFAWMLLYDALFLISVLIIITIINLFQTATRGFTQTMLNMKLDALLLLLFIINVMLCAAVYSYFKCKILKIMFSFHNKAVIINYKQFFLLNLIVCFIAYFGIYLISAVLSVAMKKEYIDYASLFFIMLFCLLTYAFVSVLHIIFAQKTKTKAVKIKGIIKVSRIIKEPGIIKESIIKESLQGAWKLMQTKNPYVPIGVALLFFLAAAMAIAIITLVIIYIVQTISPASISLSLARAVAIAVSLIFAAIVYALILFSRVYYLELLDEQK